MTQYKEEVLYIISGLGEKLTNKKVMEKVLVNLVKKFEIKILFLEDSRDLNQIKLLELVNIL